MKQTLIYDKNDLIVIQATGQIEYEDKEELNNIFHKVYELGKKNVIFDMGAINYIGSSGIGVIAKFYKRFRAREGNVYLYNIQDNVKKIFDNIGLSEHISFINGSFEAVIKEVENENKS